MIISKAAAKLRDEMSNKGIRQHVLFSIVQTHTRIAPPNNILFTNLMTIHAIREPKNRAFKNQYPPSSCSAERIFTKISNALVFISANV